MNEKRFIFMFLQVGGKVEKGCGELRQNNGLSGRVSRRVITANNVENALNLESTLTSSNRSNARRAIADTSSSDAPTSNCPVVVLSVKSSRKSTSSAECQGVPFELKVFEVHPPVLPGSSPRRMSDTAGGLPHHAEAASNKMTEFGDSYAKIDLFFI